MHKDEESLFMILPELAGLLYKTLENIKKEALSCRDFLPL